MPSTQFRRHSSHLIPTERTNNKITKAQHTISSLGLRHPKLLRMICTTYFCRVNPSPTPYPRGPKGPKDLFSCPSDEVTRESNQCPYAMHHTVHIPSTCIACIASDNHLAPRASTCRIPRIARIASPLGSRGAGERGCAPGQSHIAACGSSVDSLMHAEPPHVHFSAKNVMHM